MQVPRCKQILSISEMCDKSKTKESSWPDTNYRLYFIYKLCCFYCKEEWEWTGGGCCSLQIWQMHAVKFHGNFEFLKIRRTLTDLRTTLFKFLKMRESTQTQTFGRTSNRTTLYPSVWVVNSVCYVLGKKCAHDHRKQRCNAAQLAPC